MRQTRLEETRNADECSFASLITELKNDLGAFLETRFQLLISELHEKSGSAKRTAIFGGLALFFAGLAFLLLTVTAVALVTVAFLGSPFAFFWGFLIIGIFYLLLSGITGIVAYFALSGLAPEKTVKVLHDDKAWARAELRNSRGRSRFDYSDPPLMM
jgi:uncharacterized membrane protein YqjE